jgi:CelD/BcsL family acetyltransferase involved in cellulose biosynthesis
VLKEIPTQNAGYSIKEVKELHEINEVENAWDKMLGKYNSYKPYLCFSWYRLWLKHFLNGHRLLILIVSKNGTAEAIAPFLIKHEKFKGIRVKKIELIGNVYSPVQTFLFKDLNHEIREKIVAIIMDYFRRINRKWDIIDLQSIPEEDGLSQKLMDVLDKINFNKLEYFCFGNWYSDEIQCSSDIYFKNRSKNLRASIKKNFRNARDKGNLRFEMITQEDEIEKNMNRYFEVYSRSWKKGERVGPDFLTELIKYASSEGWLRLGLVSLNDITIGVGFAIVCNRFAYFEKVAFDQNYEEVGAGSIWLSEMIKHVIDVDKVKVIDLLRGDDDYKKRWVEKRRERKGILIFNKTLKGHYLSFLIRHALPIVNKSSYLRKVKEFSKRLPI